MNPPPLTYEQLERNFVTWAQKRPDLRAAIVVGSRARVDHPADQWSDLDLILFTTHPQTYASHADWLEEIGEVWVPLLNYTGRGDPEWLVLFAGGLKADFVLVVATGSLQQMIDQSPYQFVLRRGVRVLFDKDHPQVPVSLPEPCLQLHPTEDEFLATVHHVLLCAGRAAKMLKRGELWPAKVHCDGDLKQRLLTMLEWHARAAHGPGHDTWHEGRFLEEWADPRAVAALSHTFATYDADELWRALFATLDLFRWLARETAQRLDYPYPGLTDRRVMEWLRSLQG